MEAIDIVAIANLDKEQRAQKMGELFQQLLAMPVSQREEALANLIADMAQRGSDEAYLALCRTNLELAAAMPDELLRSFLKLRMSVSASLPEALSARDAAMIKNAMATVSPSVREKISAQM